MNVPISVVIRTFNSGKTLAEVLNGLKLKEKDELIIVDSGSDDNTISIAENIGAKIIHISKDDFTYGRSLNLGFRSASNEWILSLSSHCIPIPVRKDHLELFRESIKSYPNLFVAAVGPFHNSEIDRVLLGGITFYQLEDLTHGFGFPAGNPNCIYKRSVWKEHPFDEKLEASEDFEWYFWALRNGKSIAAIHAASTKYASARPMAALYKKGRLDKRHFVQNGVNVGKTKFRGILIQTIRLIGYWIMGRISWASVKNGIAYKIGSWVESRRL